MYCPRFSYAISLIEPGIYYNFALVALCNIYLLVLEKKGMIPQDVSLNEKAELHLGQNPTYFKTMCCSVCLSNVSGILLIQNSFGFFSYSTS